MACEVTYDVDMAGLNKEERHDPCGGGEREESKRRGIGNATLAVAHTSNPDQQSNPGGSQKLLTIQGIQARSKSSEAISPDSNE